MKDLPYQSLHNKSITSLLPTTYVYLYEECYITDPIFKMPIFKNVTDHKYVCTWQSRGVEAKLKVAGQNLWAPNLISCQEDLNVGEVLATYIRS